MEETATGSENEQTEPAEGDNETPVIEPETPPADQPADPPAGDPAETPVEPVTTPDPEEPVVTPEEPAVTPVEPVEEPEETVEEIPEFTTNAFDDEIMEVQPSITVAWQKDGSADGAPTSSIVFDANTVAGTEGAYTTKDESTDVKFNVTLGNELTLGEVTAAIGETAVTVGGNATDGFTITRANITGNITITVKVLTKTYTVNAPATANSVSWKIKKAADQAYGDPGTSVSVPKSSDGNGVALKLQATLADNAPAVDVTVGETTKSLSATTKTAEFDVTVAYSDLGDTAYTIAVKKYEVKAEVTVKGKTEADTFTTQYAVKKDDEFGTWTAVPATGKIAAAVGDVIGLKFAVTGNKAIKTVTFDSTEKPADADGIYEITVTAPATGNNTVEVVLEAAKFITVKGADANAQIDSVSYAVDGGSDKAAVKSGADWKISVPTTGTTNVTVKVTAKEHNQVTYIHKGADAHPATGCDKDAFSGPAAAEATTSNIAIATDIPDAGLTLSVGTEKITVAYELTEPAELGAKIKDASGTEVVKQPDTAANAIKGKYVLNDGESYRIVIDDAKLATVASVKANGVDTALKLYSDGFRFTANANATAKTIVIAGKTLAAQTITVVYKNADGVVVSGTDFAATIQADAYKTSADASTGAVVAKTDISADADSPTTYSVWEDTPFAFVVAPKDENYYKIDKVAVETDGVTLTETGGKYTIAKAKDCTIAVTVALDTDKAESIKFNFDEADVDSVKASLTGDAAPATNGVAVTAGETVYFKKAAENKVTFAVTPATGYTVDTVKAGEVALTAASGVYTYTYQGTTKAAEITITTKATALTEDKYVTFDVNANSGVTVKVDEKVTPVEKDGKKIYKLTQAKPAESSNPAVAEIPELAFDVIVPYGKYLANTSFVTGAVRATAAKRALKDDAWVYSYKVVANQVTSTEAAPAEINFAANTAVTEKVTLKTKAGTVKYKNLNANPAMTEFADLDSTGAVKVDIGDAIVVELAEGQSLKINDEECKPDELGKFCFEAELQDGAGDDASEMVLDVTTAAAEFNLKYAVNPEDPTDITYDVAGSTAIETEIGDKVYVKLVTKQGAAQAISSRKTSEGATSVVTLQNQETKAGEAVIDVKDESFSVDFFYEHDVPDGSLTKVVEDKAASISITAKDAAKAEISAKGINKNGKTVLKLDATSETKIPLTIKKDKKVVSAAAYDETFQAPVVTDKTVAEVSVVDGNLVIKTLKGEKAQTEVKLLAKGQAADAAPILSFKVEGQTPALKVSKVESPNQGIMDLLVNVTADGGIKTVSDKFHLYYEIGVAKNAANPATTDIEGYYYLPAETDAKGKIAPVSQMVKVNSETTKEKTPNKYTVSARMVAVSGTALTGAQMGNPQKGTKVAQITPAFAGAEVKKEFTTKTLYYEDKLGVTKKTTKFYSGQDPVLVAIPKFSKNAGYVNDIQAVIYNKDGSLADDDKIWAYAVDKDTMEVTVGSSYNAAGNYDVVIYATATRAGGDDGDYDMYRASAKVPITVQKAINYVEVDSVDEITIPNYSTAKAKDASFTLKPVGYYTYYSKGSSYNVKAQTQKFVCDVDSESFGNPKNADKVVVKGNKITVKKNFYVGEDPDDNKFTVRVIAADYGTKEENIDASRCTYFDVYVTKNALELGSVQLKVGSKIYSDKAEITAYELDGAQVIVKDKAGREVSARLLDFTPNKGNVYVYKDSYDEYNTAKVRANAFAKTLTIKAVTRDGGKKNASAKFTVKQKGGNFVLGTYNSDSGTWSENPTISNSRLLTKTGSTAWSFRGANDDTIRFTIVNKEVDSEGDASYVQASKTYYNYTVKITGGKNTSGKSGEAYGNYKIAPTAGKVVVAITDKTVKNAKPVEFTITNTGWTAEKAPNASTKDKLYVAYNPTSDSETSDIRQDLTYTVKGNKSYDAVQFTWLSGYVTNLSSTFVRPIANDQFKLENVCGSKVGTEKYSLVYGKMENGTFHPMTKAANLSIKVTAVGKIKPTNKYTISTNVGWSVKLDAKPALKFKDYNDEKQDIVKYVRVLSANVKGERNQFVDYFEVVDGRLQIKAAKRTEAELDKLKKDDYVGYLEYRYAVGDDTVVTQQEKITVKIDEKGAPKYAATPINVVAKAGVKATTAITLGGEEVAIGKVGIAAGSDWTAACATADDAANGIVTLTAAQAPASKNVDLYIVPADAKDAATADPLVKGIKVTVTVKTVPENDAKTKISISKKAKVPTAAIVGGNSVELTAVFEEGKDFTCLWENAALTNAQKLTDTEADALTKPADKANAKLVKNVTFTDGEKKKITMTFDRDKLPTPKGKTVYTIPVKLTFAAGEVETVSFSVQPEVVPVMTDVEKIVKGALDKYPVSDVNTSETAISEVTAALADVEIPALSGITAGPVAVKNAETFADKTANGTTTPGDHTLTVTLTDVTKAADAEGKTSKVDITVTAKVTLDAAIKEAVDKWRVKSGDTALPAGKTEITPTSPTEYEVRDAIQAAVDSIYEKGKYIVAVSDFNIATTQVPAQSATSSINAGEAATVTKVTGMTFKYTVKDALTKQNLGTEKGDAAAYAVSAGTDATAATVATPTLPVTPVNPGQDKATVASVAVTAANSATDITQGVALTFTAKVTDSKGNKITTKSGLADLKDAPTLEWKVEKKNGNEYEAITEGITLTPDGTNLTASLTVAETVAAETELKITATVGEETANVTVTVKAANTGV